MSPASSPLPELLLLTSSSWTILPMDLLLSFVSGGTGPALRGCCHPSRPCSRGRQRGIRGAGSSDKGELIGLLLLLWPFYCLGSPQKECLLTGRSGLPAGKQLGEAAPGVGAGWVSSLGRKGREGGGIQPHFLPGLLSPCLGGPFLRICLGNASRAGVRARPAGTPQLCRLLAR